MLMMMMVVVALLYLFYVSGHEWQSCNVLKNCLNFKIGNSSSTSAAILLLVGNGKGKRVFV